MSQFESLKKQKDDFQKETSVKFESSEKSKKDKIENQEDLEKSTRKIISEIEKDESDFAEHGEEGIKNSNDSVDLLPEKVREVEEKTGIRGKLADLAKKFAENGKKKMIIAALGMSVLASPGDFKEAAAAEKYEESEKMESVLDKKEFKETDYNKKIEELRESVWKDEKERSLVVYKIDSKTESFEVEDCNINFCYVPLDKLKEAIRKGSKEVKSIHTHPLEAYPIFKDEKEKIRKGEMKAIPMPPSQTDLTGLIQEFNFLKSNNLDLDSVENKIIDPTGEWTYKIGDQNNYFVNQLGTILEKYLNPEFLEKTLSEEEKKEIRKKGDLINDTHPEFRAIYIPDRIQSMLLEELNKEFPNKKMLGFLGENKRDYLENFSRIDKLIVEIGNYDKSRTKEKMEMLIKEYIERCKRIGISVSYKPFEEKNQ